MGNSKSTLGKDGNPKVKGRAHFSITVDLESSDSDMTNIVSDVKSLLDFAREQAMCLPVVNSLDDVVQRLENRAVRLEAVPKSAKTPSSTLHPKHVSKPRVNYFLSIRINNEQIKSQAQEAIDSIVAACPEAKRCVVPVRDLHLTLFVFYLGSAEDVMRAKELLETTAGEVQEIIGASKGLTLNFANVGSFRKDVLYIDVERNEPYGRFIAVARMLYEKFLKAGFVAPDSQAGMKEQGDALPLLDLNPHATLFKTSKARFKRGEKRTKIKLLAPEDVKKWTFGECSFDRIELSSMQTKDDEGYYACKGFVPLPAPSLQPMTLKTDEKGF